MDKEKTYEGLTLNEVNEALSEAAEYFDKQLQDNFDDEMDKMAEADERREREFRAVRRQ